MKSSSQEFVHESHAIDISQVTDSALAHKMSICSTEVTNINEQRSAVETIAESIDTQILVNTLTKERPKTPPPVLKIKESKPKDSPPVKLDNTPAEENIEEQTCCANKCDKRQCKNPKCTKAKCAKEMSVVSCPLQQKECPLFVEKVKEEMNVVKSHEEHCEKSVVAMRSSTETVVKNPVPQEWISPMVKALTIASDKPFNAVAIDIETIERSASNPTETHISKVSAVVETEDYMKQHAIEYTHKTDETHVSCSPVPSEKVERGTKFQHEIRITPDNLDQKPLDEPCKPQEPSRFPYATVTAPVAASQFARALTIAPATPFSPTPKISMEPVALPEETVPYFPKEVPITVEPKVTPKRVDVCKSPFVEALTTAPERPYSPIAVAPGTIVNEVPAYMKDLPAPPKEKVSMLSALTVATERPFTPVLFDSVQKSVQIAPLPPPEPPQPAPPKPVQKKVERSYIPAKPASHLTPSAFRPLGATKFKPVSETFKPEQEFAQPPHSFPPVTQELRSSSAKGREFSSPIPIVQVQNVEVQKQMTQQEMMEEEYRRHDVRKQGFQYTGAGLQKATNIPSYQKNIQTYNQQLPTVQTFDQYEQARVSIMPKPVQKPITTLQPGGFQPNIPHTSFQPVSEDRETYNGKISHPLPRSVSPSMINKPAPPIPYYQQHLVAEEHLAVESNLYDPKSPAVSRSPTPVMGLTVSPYPHHVPRAKSPAQGPPPNPLKPKPATPVHDSRYVEAKQSLGSYIPKYQGKVEHYYTRPPFLDDQQLKPAEYAVSDSSYDVSQYHNQYSSENQYGNEICHIQASEDVKHTQQLNKSEMQSVETSADNLVQVQRRKRCTEEFERTQKVKTIEIERSSGATMTRNVQNVGMQASGATMIRNVNEVGMQGGHSVQKHAYETTMPKSPASHYYPRKTPPPPSSPAAKFQKPVPFGSSTPQARSYSLPGASGQPKQSKAGYQVRPEMQSPSPQPSYPISSTKQVFQPSTMTASNVSRYPPSPLAVSPSPCQSYQAPSVARQSVSKPVAKPVCLPANQPLSTKTPVGQSASSNVSRPDVGAGGRQAGAVAFSPKRGRGVLNKAALPGSRVPLCGHCNNQIRYRGV